MEHNRFLQQQLSQDDSGLSRQEQIAVIQKMLDAADAHMKQWVSDREPR